ncbi:uncharacterized protein FIESC28_01553 [Fusarium coffeatum]|uniref:Uncharacterized protein n=1 Tax=Fusarium coffeatum TaxID=231269 RepID=A0A366SA43_9HYPO|nr:uncharacterized protein FIESC28_01553 [Fusarium coffeatum]RBR25590.1 hypothetical protein FIESC28_01553 [Fusarium coffeatum]
MVSFKSVLLFTGLAMAAPTRETEKSLTKRFNGGWCGVHIHLFQGENAKGSHEMNVFVYDGKQQMVWSQESIWGDGLLMAKSEGLPAELNINTFGSNALATFTYGDDQAWDSKEQPRCSVGAWDGPGFLSTTQTLEMDCGFSC